MGLLWFIGSQLSDGIKLERGLCLMFSSQIFSLLHYLTSSFLPCSFPVSLPPSLPLLTDFTVEQKLLMTSTCFLKDVPRERGQKLRGLPCACCAPTYAGLHMQACVQMYSNALTLVRLQEEPARTSLGGRISQITTEQHWSTPVCSFSLPCCVWAVNHYIWRLVCLHSCMMVDRRPLPHLLCLNLHWKNKPSLILTSLTLFMWSLFCC